MCVGPGPKYPTLRWGNKPKKKPSQEFGKLRYKKGPGSTRDDLNTRIWFKHETSNFWKKTKRFLIFYHSVKRKEKKNLTNVNL